jgi:integrase
MQAILAELQLRERVLLFLDMVTGLRRGELTGIKCEDIDFEQLEIHVQRSVVEQVVGRCKTEASQKSIPLDELTAQDLLAWYRGSVSKSGRLGLCLQQQAGGKEAREATAMVVDHHALSHPAGGQATRHQQASLLAHLPAHLLDASPCEW